MNKVLHIVCFDAPAPPDYGGVIDVFYKIKALAEAGMHIHLHYFQYKAERGHEALAPFCKSIHVYTRKNFLQCLTSPQPFIVASRVNKHLIEKLNKDAHPVLLEGIHCTGILPYLRTDKKAMVRLHNNEAAYYRQLAQNETHLGRNLFYSMEATRLERYQKALPHDIACVAVAQTDFQFFQDRLGWSNITFVPIFVPWQQPDVKEGTGTYCLYHGNLSVSENKAAVNWLLKHVFAGTHIPFIVAGKAPDEKLRKSIAQHANMKLIADPSDAQLADLIDHAQINVLPSLNITGVKLKLLHALFRGRHCITNKAGVAGSGLENAVQVLEDAESIKTAILKLMDQPFKEAELLQRNTLLEAYNNYRNAEMLSAWV